MKITKSLPGLFLVAAIASLTACKQPTPEQIPEAWQHLVQADGQFYPVPESWLATPEGKVAHGLKLPEAAPRPVPFDFDSVPSPWYRKPDRKEVALAYIRHLCRTEAGEWIFRKVDNVEGLYFARPESAPTDQYLQDPYGPEAPWVERSFQLWGSSLERHAGQFVDPPAFSYHFMEEPRREEVKWQSEITEPYIRFFGYTSEVELNPNFKVILGASRFLKITEKTPMQMIGIAEPSARYAYTWRGITRPRDREFGIAGGELIIYDLKTKEILGFRRNFQLSLRNPRGPGGASWLVAPTCPKLFDDIGFRTLSEFAVRVLPTIEPSYTGRKAE